MSPVLSWPVNGSFLGQACHWNLTLVSVPVSLPPRLLYGLQVHPRRLHRKSRKHYCNHYTPLSRSDLLPPIWVTIAWMIQPQYVMCGSPRFLSKLLSNTHISIINKHQTPTIELGVMPHVVLKILIATSADTFITLLDKVPETSQRFNMATTLTKTNICKQTYCRLHVTLPTPHFVFIFELIFNLLFLSQFLSELSETWNAIRLVCYLDAPNSTSPKYIYLKMVFHTSRVDYQSAQKVHFQIDLFGTCTVGSTKVTYK
jgi:hypothetical protein